MTQKTTIQKFTAVLLLLVFVISITPKAFFHDLLANHEDSPDCRQLHHSKVLHQQAFNCHFEDLVATGPFVLLTDPFTATTNHYLANKQVSFYCSHLESFFQHKESRGPPHV